MIIIVVIDMKLLVCIVIAIIINITIQTIPVIASIDQQNPK